MNSKMKLAILALTLAGLAAAAAATGHLPALMLGIVLAVIAYLARPKTPG